MYRHHAQQTVAEIQMNPLWEDSLAAAWEGEACMEGCKGRIYQRHWGGDGVLPRDIRSGKDIKAFHFFAPAA